MSSHGSQLGSAVKELDNHLDLRYERHWSLVERLQAIQIHILLEILGYLIITMTRDGSLNWQETESYPYPVVLCACIFQCVTNDFLLTFIPDLVF